MLTDLHEGAGKAGGDRINANQTDAAERTRAPR